MNACKTISAYLDGRLETAGMQEFEAHLEGCVECRRAVEAWRDITNRIVEISTTDPVVVDPTAHEALRLVQRAEIERGSTALQPRFRVAAAVLSATVLLALGAIAGYWMAGHSAPDQARQKGVVPLDEALVYRTDSHSRTSVELGSDIVHLGPASDVQVVKSGPETRLALRKGSLACDVADRTDGGGFFVEASDFTVQVTGTRFLVDLASGENPARVVVSEGAVEVRSTAIGTHRLGAKEGLEIRATATVRPAKSAVLAAIDDLFDRPSPAPDTLAIADTSPDSEGAAHEEIGVDVSPQQVAPAPDGVGTSAQDPDDVDVLQMERWRGWVIEGRLDEARFALCNYLDIHPTDADAWSLLADCERKRASWGDAVAAYDRLVALSSGEKANRARFKAAQILQDRLGDHGRAVEFLERFLAQGGSGSLLVDKARIRLARSLVALGHRDRARGQLSQVIENAGDGQMVTRARQLLEQLDQE